MDTKEQEVFYVEPGNSEEQIRALLKEHPGNLRLVLKRGVHFWNTGILLGRENANLRVEGEKGARIVGGTGICGWEKVRDPAVLSRLSPDARDKVLTAKITPRGKGGIERLSRRGYSGDGGVGHSELFVNGLRMELARYPKKDKFLKITGYEEEFFNECEEAIGVPEKGFFYADERPKAWKEQEIWVHGYWCWDWANSYEPVGELDAAAGRIRLKNAPPNRVRGYKAGQRFFFLNVLEEVTTPGDYYIDRENALVYFYPTDAFNPDGEAFVSTLGSPFFTLKGCTDVLFKNLQMEGICSDAFMGADCEGLLIDNCVFKNIGNYAVRLTGGHNETIQNCTIHDCGDGGVRLIGGDRVTLTRGDMRVLNTHFYNISSWSKCYCPAVLAEGVGITISGNLIHDCPHTAILWGGNDITITRNEIYSVVLETGDAGAIYAGNDITFRGNEVSENFIHHLGGVGMGTMGIYNDDALCGTVMENNIFFEVSRGVMLGGGKDFKVRNNVFIKCYPAIHMDSRAAHSEFFWGKMYEQIREKFYNARQSFEGPNSPEIRLDCSKAPYIDRYPELLEVDETYKTGRQFTASALVSNNVFCAKPLFRFYREQRDANLGKIFDCGEPADLTLAEKCLYFDPRQDVNSNWSPGKGTWTFSQNYTAAPEDFDDVGWGRPTVREDSHAADYGHVRVSLEKIGLQKEGRDDMPDEVFTSLEYPYHGEKQPLTLGIKNFGTKQSAGTLTFSSTNANVILYEKEVSFSLQPGEECFMEVGELNGETVFCVEASSATPGVRPARAENIEGSWKRF